MRHQACNDSPYHLAMLLQWGAHMNLQQVTQSAWPSYVLTYSMQCEPISYLRLRPSGAMLMLGVDPTISAWLCNMTDSSPLVSPGCIVHDL